MQYLVLDQYMSSSSLPSLYLAFIGVPSIGAVSIGCHCISVPFRFGQTP